MSTEPHATLRTPSAPQSDRADLWAALAEASSDGLLVVSPDGVMLAMNRRFAEVWGFDDEVLRSRDDDRMLRAARDLVADPDAFAQRIQQIYAARTRSEDEIELLDGRVLDRFGSPLYDADDTYLGFAWRFRDVTDQRRAAAELRRLAETLQASLLPPRPPEIPGVEVAARYQPARGNIMVGGDFYDVFRLGPNEWGLVLGDVCGKGVHAARLTALSRYTIRAAAGHHAAPEDVLGELNDILLDDADLGERFVSAVYARLEQDVCGAWLTLAVAGHPLPLVVRRAGWIDVRGQVGGLLGLFRDSDVAEDRVGLGPGDAIVLCTDGITEVRNGDGEEFADECLPDVLLRNHQSSASDLADAILAAAESFAAESFHDDVAVLVVRVPPDAGDNPDGRLRAATGVRDGELPLPSYPVGEPHFGPSWRPRPPREARLKLSSHPSSAAAARQFVAGVLHSWRMSAMAEGDVQLLTSELVGNAVRHGEAPFSVIVHYDGDTIRIAVGDGSRELPRRLQAPADATGGRGIHIVSEVAADWGVTNTIDGKRVWFTLPAI